MLQDALNKAFGIEFKEHKRANLGSDTRDCLEVIGAGLPRCGTTSLKAALEFLGFDPCHHMIVCSLRPLTLICGTYLAIVPSAVALDLWGRLAVNHLQTSRKIIVPSRRESPRLMFLLGVHIPRVPGSSPMSSVLETTIPRAQIALVSKKFAALCVAFVLPSTLQIATFTVNS